jgi:hypothetical protein
MLPSDFRFSQTSLQNYVDCPRRFQLRYVDAQPWPAVQSQPVLERERHLDLGTRFHRLVERHQLGMEPDTLARMIDDPQLQAWWSAYLGFDYLHSMEGKRFPEFRASVDLEGHRLVVAYDLLVFRPDRTVVIFDWKTHRWPPSVEWFAARVQTRLYPLVLVLAARQGIFSAAVGPEQVSLVYWLVGSSGNVVEFPYGAAQFESDLGYVMSVLRGIERESDEGEWYKTANESLCRLCEYRSLCGRDVEIGAFDQAGNEDGNIAGEEGFWFDDVLEVGF